MPNKNGISADRLDAALSELEESIQKGDPLQDQPHDGGLATQGTNIQSRADAKKAAAKALTDSGMSKADADKVLKMLSASDMGSGEGEDDEEPSGRDMESDEDEEDADAIKARKAKKAYKSEPDPDLKKALVDENPDNEKLFNVAPFLEQLVGQLGRMSGNTQQQVDSLTKSLDTATKRQGDFNVRLAKGLVNIVGALNDQYQSLNEKIEKILNQPVPNGRQTAVVRKSDVQQPNFGGPQFREPGANDGRNPNEASPLLQVDYLVIQRKLADYVMKGGLDPIEVTKFENDKGNFNVLPPAIVKRLEQDLCSSAA